MIFSINSYISFYLNYLIFFLEILSICIVSKKDLIKDL